MSLQGRLLPKGIVYVTKTSDGRIILARDRPEPGKCGLFGCSSGSLLAAPFLEIGDQRAAAVRANGGVHVGEFLARWTPYVSRRVGAGIARDGDVDKMKGNRNDQCCATSQRGGDDVQHDKYEVTHLRYFTRFFGFAFGVCGSGGLFSIVRSRSLVRRIPSRCWTKSSFASSLARSVAVSGLRFVMVGV